MNQMLDKHAQELNHHLYGNSKFNNDESFDMIKEESNQTIETSDSPIEFINKSQSKMNKSKQKKLRKQNDFDMLRQKALDETSNMIDWKKIEADDLAFQLSTLNLTIHPVNF